MKLEGRNVIVTGASSGIGRGIALKIAEEGADVVVADIQEQPRKGGEPTHLKVQELDQRSKFVKTDVSDEESVKDMVYEAAEFLGQIDGLVNNAGVHHSASVTDEDPESWKELMEVNLDGVFYCMKNVIEHMEEEEIQGDIVNIASIAGIVGFGESAAYCASKGGVVELTREVALDYGPDGLNVNSISPGVIRTAMTDKFMEDDEARENFEQQTVTPRLGGPEDIANAVSFLLSDESNFILGENLVVDGGWTAK